MDPTPETSDNSAQWLSIDSILSNIGELGCIGEANVQHLCASTSFYPDTQNVIWEDVRHDANWQ